MTSFSERLGITQPKAIQLNNLDTELRNSLWNVCRTFFFIPLSGDLYDDHMRHVAIALYRDYLKLPIERLPDSTSRFVESQLDFFQTAQWYEVLNLVEFLHSQYLSQRINPQNFEQKINEVLEREKSAYRFIAGNLASITNEIEMQELEQAARHGNRFAPVSEHVRTALELYSKKPQPDYRNSIKESISAVESAAKIITKLSTATLDEAIKVIDQTHSLHGAFKTGISKLYGYASDEGGIRHSLTEATNIDEADARYMLVSCSAFANYLISRYDNRPPLY
jgi:AbiJ N-terminal domain 4